MGEANKGAVVLILVLLFGAGGYLWYSQMYKPAVDMRTQAVAGQQTAEQDLQAARAELASAEQRIEESRNELAKPDDSVSKVQVATKAVPRDKLIDDAAIVLMDLADQAGIKTSFSAEDTDDVGALPDASISGALPIDLEFEAVGTYDEMMLFMSLAENTVERRDGKIYTRDRLFNVVRLEIGSDEEGASSDSGTLLSGGFTENLGGEDELKPGPGELLFTVTVRMYTSSAENAQNVGVATPDPAAAATDPAAAGGATDPAAAGGAPVDTAAGGTPVDSAASGATPAADPATAGAAPAGGGF